MQSLQEEGLPEAPSAMPRSPKPARRYASRQHGASQIRMQGLAVALRALVSVLLGNIGWTSRSTSCNLSPADDPASERNQPSTGCDAERFAAAGFTVLVFDYRRFGNHEGRERNAGKENAP